MNDTIIFPFLIIIFSGLILFYILNDKKNKKLINCIEKFQNSYIDKIATKLDSNSINNTEFTKDVAQGSWTTLETKVDANYNATNLMVINITSLPGTIESLNYGTITFGDNNFFNIGYSQMYIDILIKTIFEKEDITRMFFNCSYINDNLSLFINCIIKYYKDLDTVCFDLNYDRRYTFNNKYSFISELNKLFDKISNTKNVYLNSFLFKIVKEINLLNNDNIYIFGDEVITNCDYILKKIKSFSNNIFIKHRNNIQIENNGWINMAIYDDNNYLIMKK